MCRWISYTCKESNRVGGLSDIDGSDVERLCEAPCNICHRETNHHRDPGVLLSALYSWFNKI